MGNYNKCMLLHLNVYCLLDLFKRLSLRDKIRCAASDKGLLDFYIEEIAPTHRKLSMDDVENLSYITKADFGDFLEATAQFFNEVEMIYCKLSTDISLPLFRYGNNIKHVNIDGAGAHFANVLAYGQSITELNASGCNLRDYNIKALQQLPNLRVLRLEANFDISGKHLASLHNVEELYLAHNNLAPSYVRQIARYCSNLRTLDLRLFKMDAKTSQVIGKNCKKLETLCFSHDGKKYTAFGRLPNLRRLGIDIDDIYLRHDDLIPLLDALPEQLEDLRCNGGVFKSPLIEAVAKFKNLKTFYLTGSDFKHSQEFVCSLEKLEKLCVLFGEGVHAERILEVLENCKNLNYLSVRCANLSEDFLYRVVGILKERKAQHQQQSKEPWKPFVLVINESIGQPVRTSILQDPHTSSVLKVCNVWFDFFDFQNR